MFGWFRTWLGYTTLPTPQEREAALVASIAHLKAIRQELATLYYETELTCQALDALGCRLQAVQEQAQARQHEEAPRRQLTPMVFEGEHRQRAGAQRG